MIPSRIFTSISIFLVILVFAASHQPANAGACKQADLYGINWSVDGCSCAADTLSKPKTGAFAEDTIGFSRGWIDARDLICDAKTGKWSAKTNPKFTACSGCKPGFGANGTCGPATQKHHANAPKADLCACGTASKVKRAGSWHWQCGIDPNKPPANCYAPAITKQENR